MTEPDPPPKHPPFTFAPGTIALFVGFLAAVFIAIAIFAGIGYVSYQDKARAYDKLVAQTDCRTALAVGVDVTSGPVILGVGALLTDVAGGLLQGRPDPAKLQADVDALHAGTGAYEKALADRSNTDQLCP